MKRWFAVYTKAGKERLAEGNLAAQGFETYLPRLARQRGRAKRVLPGPVPMFPRYLFVRLDLDAGPWRAVHSTYGVSRLVSFGDRPAPLPDAVIDGLRAREGADGIISLSEIVAPFKPGEAVEIAEGPLSDVRAMVCAQSGQERVVVLMTLLGRQVPVRVGPDRLRRAS
jgi:transcriptional antiterminator RfaH